MKQLVKGSTGLHIMTITGMEFDVDGAVSYEWFEGDGLIYYCDGRSFMSNNVVAIHEKDEV